MRGAQPAPVAAAIAHSQALGFATLVTWMLTAGIGAHMLRGVSAGGGMRRQRARRGGLSPVVLFAHFTLALCGLAAWAGYLATGWGALAWLAVGLLMPAIGLGFCTVVLWTPYPDLHAARQAHPGQAGPASGMLASPSEDMLASKLTDDALASAFANQALISRLVEEVVASVRADPSRGVRKPGRGNLAALIPVGHGIGALTTFLLAVITAAGAA